MKNLLLSAFFASLLFACATKQAKNNKEESLTNTTETSSCCASKSAEVSVDQLLLSPDNYIDKKIDLKGLVVHTCKKSGKKMFLKGKNDSVYIRVEAGENIAQFETSLEGDSVIATGYVKVITMNEKHEEEDSCNSEQKSKEYLLACEKYKTL